MNGKNGCEKCHKSCATCKGGESTDCLSFAVIDEGKDIISTLSISLLVIFSLLSTASIIIIYCFYKKNK